MMHRWYVAPSRSTGLSHSTPGKSGATGGVARPASRICAALDAPAFQPSGRSFAGLRVACAMR